MEFLHLLAGIRSPFLTTVMSLVTLIGNEIIAIGVICFLYWCCNKNLAYKLGIVFFFSGLFIQALKITFKVDRPWVIDPSFKPVESALDGATGYSFPSGHAQSSTSLFGTLAVYFKKAWMKILCIALMLIIPFSRMYLGVHTPDDIIVSMAISGIMLLIIELVMRKLENNTSHDLLLSIIFAVVALGVMAYSLVLLKKGLIEIKYVSDCCKASAAGLGFAVSWYIERAYIKFDTKTEKVWQQIVKLAVGVGIALAIKSLPKVIFGETLIVDIIRYFIVVLWVLLIYPMLFQKVLNKTGSKKSA